MNARRLLAAAALAPVVKAVVGGSRFTLSAASSRRRNGQMSSGVPTPEPSVGLAAAVAVDELFTMPMGLLASVFADAHYERSSAELDEAVRYYDEHGWLESSADYFLDPTTPVMSLPQPGAGGVEVATFESAWEPRSGEVGRDRWSQWDENSEVPVTLLRHPGRPRPWLVALHGQGMGSRADARMLRMRKVHERLGINVALPVLPLHGTRRAGMAADRQFVSNVYPVNNVLGLSQATWDVRRVLRWLRDEEAAPRVGVLGFSLGSYVCSLLATIEVDLDCAIAVVPSADLAGALRAAEPLHPRKRQLHRQVHDWRSTLIHQVVSPIARPCLVASERRFIVAGQGDQVARPAGAALLAEHWGPACVTWRPRGHLTTGASSAYDSLLLSLLEQSGLAV